MHHQISLVYPVIIFFTLDDNPRRKLVRRETKPPLEKKKKNPTPSCTFLLNSLGYPLSNHLQLDFTGLDEVGWVLFVAEEEVVVMCAVG